MSQKYKRIIITVPIEDKPIKIIKTYGLVILEYEDGSGVIHRENRGFVAFDLIGRLYQIVTDLLNQVQFPDKYNIIRTGISTDGKKYVIKKK